MSAKESRRQFLKKAGFTAASAGAFGVLSRSARAGQGDRPNIIFIMTDDHDLQAMSAYGSRLNKTPNIDRLADEGVRFNHCMCTNSICEPSRATILTGKYSHKNGVLDNMTNFDGSQTTFPKLLQRAGYQTAMIGKWHLKSDPTGFDYWSVLPGQGQYYNPVFRQPGGRKQYTGYVTNVTTDLALDWLEKRESGKPFCMLFQHKAPHRNFAPPLRHLDLFKDEDIPEPPTLFDDYWGRSAAASQQKLSIHDEMNEYDLKLQPQRHQNDQQRKEWNEAYRDRIREWEKGGMEGEELTRWKYQAYMQDYLRTVKAVDESVGRLLDYLDQSGLAENTVVVYTSDQGFFLGNHGWFDKRFMYEEPLHMPFIVRYPRGIKGGSVRDDLVLNVDFAPTFLDLAGASIPGDMQGRSIRPLLSGQRPDDWRTSMYYHYYEYPSWHMVKRHYGVRTERFKLIHFYYDIDAWELYDLKEDPHEMNNVISDPAYTDVRDRLKAEITRLQKQYGDSESLARDYLNRYLKEHAGLVKRMKSRYDL